MMRIRSYAGLLELITSDHPHFAALLDLASPKVRERLAAMAHVRTLAAGDELLPEGAESNELGYVLDGALGMVKTLNDNRFHIIGILVPTDMYGRLFDGPSDHRLVALADSKVLAFDRQRFEDMLRDAPDLERMFLVSVLDELDAAREWILVLNGTRVVNRVASFLVILARRQSQFREGRMNDPLEIAVPLTRKDFAAFLGVRTESLSRAIQQMAREGVIEILEPDRFRVPDIGRLIEASGQDLVIPEPAAKTRPTRERRQVLR